MCLVSKGRKETSCSEGVAQLKEESRGMVICEEKDFLSGQTLLLVEESVAMPIGAVANLVQVIIITGTPTTHVTIF